MEPEHNEKLSLTEYFDSPEDPNFQYLYETEHACNGKIFGPLQFRHRHVPLNFCIFVSLTMTRPGRNM